MNYPKIKLKKSYDNIVTIDSCRLMVCSGKASVDGTRGCLESRDSGEFKGKGFYLGGGFDWVLGADSEGVLVLVPLKREEK